MQNSVVPVITERRNVVALFITKDLPNGFRNICTAIKKTSINQDNNWLISDHLRNTQEGVFKSNLLFHQCLLEHKTLLLSE
jgi:hypothetical protein